MIKAILFDVDGVLVDSDEAIVRSFLHIFSHNHLPMPARKEIVKSMGKTTEEWIKALLPKKLAKNKKVIEKLAREMNFVYPRIYFPLLAKPFPRTSEVLYVLSRKYRLAVITNEYKRVALRVLARLELLHYFPFLATRENARHGKPSPELILKALKKLCVKKSEALYVGDTAIDLTAGKKAGVKTVLLLHERNKQLKAKYKIRSLSELVSLAGRL